MTQPFPLDFEAGIQRDGTKFDAKRAVDSLWCRWRLGRPRKIGGYQQVMDFIAGTPRRVHLYYLGGNVIAHVGTTSGIQQVVFDTAGNLVSSVNRTPSNFIGGANVGFTFDAIFDTTSNVVQLVVHSSPDAALLGGAIQTVPFIGIINGVGQLTQFSAPGDTFGGVWTQPKIAGGIVAVQPFVFDFDTSGLVQWSAPNLPLTLGVTGGTSGAGQARISASKVVAGMALRGGGAQSPAALFWTLAELIGATFIGGSAQFAFNTISPSTTILANAGVVEYDGLYFWAGIDRFLVFNGTVNEVPNQQNQDWFFDNLTPGFESRVFALKVPRYGEIWWCAPMFGNTECSHAAIFNVRENTWYDTELPDGGRTAGFFAQGLRYPVMCGAVPDISGFSLWMHEIGIDRVAGTRIGPVRSYFETPWAGGPKAAQPNDSGFSVQQVEPDIIQTGNLDLYLIGASNPRAPEVQGPTVTLSAVPGTPQEQFASFKPAIPSRLVRLHVEANTVGASYVVGRMLGHVDTADQRRFN